MNGTDSPTEYHIEFVRIGRNHFVPALDLTAKGANEIAEAVHQVARKHLTSRFFDVSVDLEHGNGYIEGGRFGRFSITEGGAKTTEPADIQPGASVTTTKAADKLGNGDTWTVTGEHGRIEFDLYGEHGRIYDADGDCIDAFGDALAARVAEYAALDDDDAVFLVLANEYADQFGALTATPR